MRDTKREEIIYSEPDASSMDNLRALRRARHRLTYDCFNAIATSDGRVRCRKDRTLKDTSPDKSMLLVTVLRGGNSGICEKCPDYEGD